jgi:hypothetical protein
MSATRGTSDVRQQRVATAALILHVLFAVLLPAVGTAHEAVSADQQVHIEQTGGSPSCPRGHDEHECITCRLVTAAFLFAARGRSPEIQLSIHQSVPRAKGEVPRRLLQLSPPRSRAPPTG